MTRLTLIEQLVHRTGTLRPTTHNSMRFNRKEASDFKPNVHSGEKSSVTVTGFRMELQNSAGAMHDMLKALQLADTKEGRMTEMDVQKRRNESRSGARLQKSFLWRARRGKGLRLQSGEIWVQGMEANGQSLRPKNRSRLVCCRLESGTFSECERTDINETRHTTKCEKHDAGMGARGVRVRDQMREKDRRGHFLVKQKCSEVDHSAHMLNFAHQSSGTWMTKCQ